VTSKAYRLTRPCTLCPFRSDIRPYLTKSRVQEIERSLDRAEFPCLLEKLERPSQMMRICERIGMYDRRKLDMDAPVFESFEDMIDAQPSRGRR